MKTNLPFPAGLPCGMNPHGQNNGRESEKQAAEFLNHRLETRSEFHGVPGATSIQPVDLRSCLESWPYDPACNVLICRGADARQIILVRLPMGIQQFEIDGRPDGRRVHGEETVLQYQRVRLEAAHRTQPAIPFKLTPGECEELLREASAFCDRLLILLYLNDWARVIRDAAQILHLHEFVERHAHCDGDRILSVPSLPNVSRFEVLASAMSKLDPRQLRNPQHTTRDNNGLSEILKEGSNDVEKFARALMEQVSGGIPQQPAVHPPDEPGFHRQADFWTIRFRGQAAFLKTNKGLESLARLLGLPGREFHVCELVADHPETSFHRPNTCPDNRRHGSEGELFVATGHNGSPLLDPQAKAACKRRLEELRGQEDEAERFNDPDRAAKARAEIEAIARYLATATGLGGRNRKTSSDAERARCAVTKRIKQAIQKITEAIPSLGLHLNTRIKTGYYCSYNPHPDRPVEWKF